MSQRKTKNTIIKKSKRKDKDKKNNRQSDILRSSVSNNAKSEYVYAIKKDIDTICSQIGLLEVLLCLLLLIIKPPNTTLIILLDRAEFQF